VGSSKEPRNVCKRVSHRSCANRLRAFFADCDARETGQEPDWELQRALVEESLRHGATGT